jgi:hypothetical protein
MQQENRPASSTENNARPRPYVISCMRFDLEPDAPYQNVRELVATHPRYPADHYHGPTYQHFIHEADARLMELGEAIAQGEMTVDDAYEAFRPYADLFPEMYTPEFQEERGEDFPLVGFEYDFMPVSEQFWHEATALNIPDVGINLGMPSPVSIFEATPSETISSPSRHGE